MKNKICDKATSTLLHTIKRIIYACVCTLGERSPYFPQSMFTSSQFSFERTSLGSRQFLVRSNGQNISGIHPQIYDCACADLFYLRGGRGGCLDLPWKIQIQQKLPKICFGTPHTHTPPWKNVLLFILHFLLNFTINHPFFTIQFSFFQL